MGGAHRRRPKVRSKLSKGNGKAQVELMKVERLSLGRFECITEEEPSSCSNYGLCGTMDCVNSIIAWN